jgi:hypothetical protein
MKPFVEKILQVFYHPAAEELIKGEARKKMVRAAIAK